MTAGGDYFAKMLQALRDLRISASDLAGFVFPLLLVFGVLCGILLARWIFRGGLSQRAIRARCVSGSGCVSAEP